MKITVDHYLVATRFQITQPRDKLSIFRGGALAMIIRHDQQGTNVHAVLSELRNYLLRDFAVRRRHVVKGNDKTTLGCTGGRDHRQELRCRDRSHFRKLR